MPNDSEGASPAQQLHESGFARLKQQMAAEQAAEQRATGGLRAGGVAPRALPPEQERRKAGDVIPPVEKK